MIVTELASIDVARDRDLSRLRRQVANHATKLTFGELSRTRLVTAASELARNMLNYGGGGQARIDELSDNGRVGLRVTFEDQGPGILNHDEAFRDGFSSGRGLGLGLGGARRLVDTFVLESEEDQGTKVSILNWL